jgi:hypothetical protein
VSANKASKGKDASRQQSSAHQQTERHC